MARTDLNTLSGCTGWWRGDSSPTSTPGSGVTWWLDRKSAGFHATQNTAALRPTYTATPKPGAVWSGNKTLPSGASTSNATQTVMAVAMLTGGGGDRTLRGASANGGLQLRVDGAGRLNLTRQGEQGLLSGATTVPLNVLCTFTGTFSSTAGRRVYLNGALDGSDSNASGLTAGRTTTIGLGYNASEAWVGSMYEVIQFSRILTDAERALVHSTWSDYYGITVADYVPDVTPPTTPRLIYWNGTSEETLTVQRWTGSALETLTLEQAP